MIGVARLAFRNKVLLAGYATMLHYAYAISISFSDSRTKVDAVQRTTDVFVTAVYREGFERNDFLFFYFDVAGLSRSRVIEFEDLRSRICCYAPEFIPGGALVDIWKRVAKVRHACCWH